MAVHYVYYFVQNLMDTLTININFDALTLIHNVYK